MKTLKKFVHYLLTGIYIVLTATIILDAASGFFGGPALAYRRSSTSYVGSLGLIAQSARFGDHGQITEVGEVWGSLVLVKQ